MWLDSRLTKDLVWAKHGSWTRLEPLELLANRLSHPRHYIFTKFCIWYICVCVFNLSLHKWVYRVYLRCKYKAWFTMSYVLDSYECISTSSCAQSSYYMTKECVRRFWHSYMFSNGFSIDWGAWVVLRKLVPRFCKVGGNEFWCLLEAFLRW